MMAVASGSTSTNDGAPIILDFNPEADGDPIPLNVNFLDQKSKSPHKNFDAAERLTTTRDGA